MTNLTPVSSFDSVPQLETTTPAKGGPGGPVNQPAQSLLNRTQYLFDMTSSLPARMTAVESGQTAGMLGYATKALMDADLAHADSTLALVTNDATTTNNATYRKSGASGSGSWVLSTDRTAAISTRVATLESGDLTAGSGFRFGALAPESGYAFALVDSQGAAVLLVGSDGTLSIPKSDFKDFIPQFLSDESGYSWAVLDSAGGIGLAVGADGYLTAKIAGKTVEGGNYLRPSINLWCLGDSLTDGAGGQTPWRTQIVPLISSRTITNAGIGGQKSPQIAARAGAYPSLLTLSGNQIPASGAVVVTTASIDLLGSTVALSMTGTLAGIPGTLARDLSGNYTFTRTTAGSATYCAPKTPFVSDTAGHDFETLIIFVGRNNIEAALADVQRDVDALAGWQKTAEKRFLILTPTNGGDITPGVATAEGIGSTLYNNIVAFEDWAVQKYGGRVLKLREFSFQFNNGSSDDLADVAAGVVPRSLRVDSTHYTTAFHGQVATLMASELNRRGW